MCTRCSATRAPRAGGVRDRVGRRARRRRRPPPRTASSAEHTRATSPTPVRSVRRAGPTERRFRSRRRFHRSRRSFHRSRFVRVREFAGAVEHVATSERRPGKSRRGDSPAETQKSSQTRGGEHHVLRRKTRSVGGAGEGTRGRRRTATASAHQFRTRVVDPDDPRAVPPRDFKPGDDAVAPGANAFSMRAPKGKRSIAVRRHVRAGGDGGVPWDERVVARASTGDASTGDASRDASRDASGMIPGAPAARPTMRPMKPARPGAGGGFAVPDPEATARGEHADDAPLPLSPVKAREPDSAPATEPPSPVAAAEPPTVQAEDAIDVVSFGGGGGDDDALEDESRVDDEPSAASEFAPELAPPPPPPTPPMVPLTLTDVPEPPPPPTDLTPPEPSRGTKHISPVPTRTASNAEGAAFFVPGGARRRSRRAPSAARRPPQRRTRFTRTTSRSTTTTKITPPRTRTVFSTGRQTASTRGATMIPSATTRRLVRFGPRRATPRRKPRRRRRPSRTPS